MTNQLLVAAALLLLVMTASAKVEVFGCSGAVQSDYCAPTPTGTENVPGFDVTAPDNSIKISIPSTADTNKQPKPLTPSPPTATPSLQCPPPPPSDTAECANWGACVYTRTYTSVSINETQCQNYQTNSNIGSNNSYNVQAGTYATTISNKVTACPTGYSAAGSSCNLTNPRAVPDNKQDWTGTISGGTPTYTPATDADNNSPTKLPVNQPAPNQVQIGTKGTNGQPQQVTGTINTGGSTIQVQSQETDGNGNSVVKTTTYTFDGAGNHIGTSVGTASGSLTGGGANGSYTPTSGSGTTFPNDYAKSGEAAAAAATLSPKLDQLHTDLTAKTGEADGTATVPTFTDGFGNAFTSLSAWTVPAHSSACPIGTFNIFESTVVMDSHCTLFEQVRPTLSLSAVAFWVVFALFIVLGA